MINSPYYWRITVALRLPTENQLLINQHYGLLTSNDRAFFSHRHACKIDETTCWLLINQKLQLSDFELSGIDCTMLRHNYIFGTARCLKSVCSSKIISKTSITFQQCMLDFCRRCRSKNPSYFIVCLSADTHSCWAYYNKEEWAFLRSWMFIVTSKFWWESDHFKVWVANIHSPVCCDYNHFISGLANTFTCASFY